MDLALENGDFKTANGIPVTLRGKEELLQRASLLLGVHRGGFVYDPELGSDLYALSSEEVEIGRAMGCIEAALRDRDDLAVTGAEPVPEGISVTVDTPFGAGTFLLPCGSEEE